MDAFEQLDSEGIGTDGRGPLLQNLFRLMSAILRIGNIFFAANGVDGVVALPSSKAHLKVACRLLGIEGKEDELVQAMTVKYVTIPGQNDPVVTKLTAFEAKKCRNSLARDLYGRAFAYIVDFLNSKMVSTKLDPSLAQEHLHWIGMLDIFGFEVGDGHTRAHTIHILQKAVQTNKIVKWT